MKKLSKSLTAIILAVVIAISAFAVNGATFQSVKKSCFFHYGIDVSRWNGNLNWKNLKNAGVEFAYIRVGIYDSDGGHLDVKFKENVKKCVENGIEFGVYVYSYVYKSSQNIKCAKWVHKQLKSLGNYTKDRDTIHVAYDIEDPIQKNAVLNRKISKTYLQNSVQKFCDKTKDYGYIPVVYSYESFFKDFLYLDKFRNKGVKIWYAQWPSESELDTTVKKEMVNNTIADIWQFASRYTINGIVFDTNVAYEDFYDYNNEDSKLTISGLDEAYSYKKSGVEPTFSIYNGKTKLKKGTDYKVFYFNNDRAGRARIKIVRYKNSKYLETKTFLFTVLPYKISGVKTTSKVNEINIKWNEVKGATSYQIFQYDENDGTYDEIDTVDTNSYDNFFLNEGTKYKLRVRAVLDTNGQTYYGDAADFTAYTKYKKVTLISAESKKKKTADITWNAKAKNCLGYQIQYSTDSSFKSYDKITVSSPETEELSLKLKSGKTYYFRMRSFNKIDNKKVYSLYSRTLSAKIK